MILEREVSTTVVKVTHFYHEGAAHIIRTTGWDRTRDLQREGAELLNH